MCSNRGRAMTLSERQLARRRACVSRCVGCVPSLVGSVNTHGSLPHITGTSMGLEIQPRLPEGLSLRGNGGWSFSRKLQPPSYPR